MKSNFVIFLFMLAVPFVVSAQSEYTIPKKHRVIQEKSVQSRNVPIGTIFSDVSFTTLQGNEYTISSITEKGPAIFVFLSAECPVAQRYAMRLKRMHSEFSDRNVTIVGVYSNENDSLEDVKAYLAKAAYQFLIVKDLDGSLARRLGATMTPQAHLIDTESALRFRGPIDDNRYVTRVKHNYLRDALVSVLNGRDVAISETPAFGCTIHLPEPPLEQQITYHEHIVPIIQQFRIFVGFLANTLKR